MDTLTHALSGALAARATEPAQSAPLPRSTRMAVGFWAAAFPDTDFMLRFVDPLTYLSAHRGVTHSLVLLPLWAAALALVFYLLYRRRYPWRAFAGVCALSLGVHIAGDVVTSFGTMIFAPFSDWRAQIPAIFIIDPYFTAIIAAGLVASRYWSHGRLPARLGLGILAAYVGVQMVQHGRAVEIGQAYAAGRNLTPAQTHALPQPLSPFHWLVVVEEPATYHLSYVSFLRDEVLTPPPDAHWLYRVYASYRPLDQLHWRRVPRYGGPDADTETARSLWESDVLRRYRRFAMLPAVYRVDRSGERVCVWFNDLRFALVGRTVPFRFGACRDDPAEPWRLFHLGSDGETEVLHAIE